MQAMSVQAVREDRQVEVWEWVFSRFRLTLASQWSELYGKEALSRINSFYSHHKKKQDSYSLLLLCPDRILPSIRISGGA